MRASLLGYALVAVACLSGGVLIGLAVADRSSTTIALAVLGSVVAIVTTFASWGLNQYSTTRAVRRYEFEKGRARYSQHADELNSHVFQPCAGATLSMGTLVNYPEGPPFFRGIVVSSGTGAISVAQLPNWDLGLEHLLADARAKEAWTLAYQATAAYIENDHRVQKMLLEKFDALVSTEYGPEMYLRRRFDDGDRPAWCDTPLLAYGVVALAQGYHYRPFYRNLTESEKRGGPRAENTASDVYGGTATSASVLWGRTSHETEPARLQRIYDQVTGEASVITEVRDLEQARQKCLSAVATFAETMRRYSDRIATSHEFEGRCEVCRNYVLE